MTFRDWGLFVALDAAVASSYPFKRIVGVEYSSELAAICNINLKKLGLSERCEVITGDAAEFEFPDGPLLAFLFNPFDSVVLKRVLKNLAAIRGPVRIANLGSGHDTIRNSGLTREIHSTGAMAIYEFSGH